MDPSKFSSDPPPFDPTEPSLPVSFPIKTLKDLKSRTYFDSFHYPFNKSSVPLQSSNGDKSLPMRPRILVCHDLQGGYTKEDKWVQGGTNPESYAIWHWHLIDVFVYFSHNLVAMPPPGWTNTGHKHGVQVLGTFIVEGDDGRAVAVELVKTKSSAHMYAERLTELAVALGFDGWLINMEVGDLNNVQVSHLEEFVRHLTHSMHSWKPGSLVIWYDSVTKDGRLEYQNQLNDKNKPFFDRCDGIFTNYWWQEDYPKKSAAAAGSRKYDVYMGIDVWGRGTYGGGQWNTPVTVEEIKRDDVSAAIFAPGWLYEEKQETDFPTAQNRWWGLIEKAWGVSQKYPKELPFYSNFDQGHGYHFSIDGGQVSNAPWNNISLQSFQPALNYLDYPYPIQVLVDLKETSYSGGGNITFNGSLEDNATFTARLFEGELLFGRLPVHFTYSVKSDGNSKVGLSLEFSSPKCEKKSVLLASWGDTLVTMNRFSSKFSNVIMPLQVIQVDSVSGWIIQEGAISMEGHTLTRINAVCYNSNSSIHNLEKQSDYYAVLGHIRAKTKAENSDFPPPSSWLVDGDYIKWTSDSQGSKILSVKLSWTLIDGNPSRFPGYNIYIDKQANAIGELQENVEYLGVAKVEAFYVSDLVFPSGSSAVNFIIQVCGADGVCQKLSDSPSFRLSVEDS